MSAQGNAPRSWASLAATPLTAQQQQQAAQRAAQAAARRAQEAFSAQVQTLLTRVRAQITSGHLLPISSNYVMDNQYQVSGQWDAAVVREAMRQWSAGPQYWGYHAMCGEKHGWREGTTQANFLCYRVPAQPNRGRNNVHVNVRT